MADTQHEQRRVCHAPDDIFDLVADVQDYPNFIKWIRAMRVLRTDVTDGVGTMLAKAIVGYKFVRESFTTRVELDRDARAIHVSFVDGPFSVLDNRWCFHPLEDGSTLVDFRITYKFRNPILQRLIEANLGRAANTLITAFEGRARERFQQVGDPDRIPADMASYLERSREQAKASLHG